MMYNPTHAGELISEWLEGCKENGQPITISQLAANIQITRAMLSRIINGKAALTADVALRLHVALGIDAEMLMKAQANHALWLASQQPRPNIMPMYQPA